MMVESDVDDGDDADVDGADGDVVMMAMFFRTILAYEADDEGLLDDDEEVAG